MATATTTTTASRAPTDAARTALGSVEHCASASTQNSASMTPCHSAGVRHRYSVELAVELRRRLSVEAGNWWRQKGASEHVQSNGLSDSSRRGGCRFDGIINRHGSTPTMRLSDASSRSKRARCSSAPAGIVVNLFSPRSRVMSASRPRSRLAGQRDRPTSRSRRTSRSTEGADGTASSSVSRRTTRVGWNSRRGRVEQGYRRQRVCHKKRPVATSGADYAGDTVQEVKFVLSAVLRLLPEQTTTNS